MWMPAHCGIQPQFGATAGHESNPLRRISFLHFFPPSIIWVDPRCVPFFSAWEPFSSWVLSVEGRCLLALAPGSRGSISCLSGDHLPFGCPQIYSTILLCRRSDTVACLHPNRGCSRKGSIGDLVTTPLLKIQPGFSSSSDRKSTCLAFLFYQQCHFWQDSVGASQAKM